MSQIKQSTIKLDFQGVFLDFYKKYIIDFDSWYLPNKFISHLWCLFYFYIDDKALQAMLVITAPLVLTQSLLKPEINLLVA
ncbi:MAG: hypothetical protein EA362_05655 [Saprospirales bacterium]|nr:MAG: hypothetical protein EA362_05655 [Saprospirales bacterium]